MTIYVICTCVLIPYLVFKNPGHCDSRQDKSSEELRDNRDNTHNYSSKFYEL